MLGPLFFVTYISDLSGVYVICKGSSIRFIYMRMTVKFTGLLILKKICLLFRVTNKRSEWCKMNKMIMNTKKGKIMRISRKKSPLVGNIAFKVNNWKV